MTLTSGRRLAFECLLGGILIYAVSIGGLKSYSIAGTPAVPLWPSSGIALGLLILRGWRLFPAITLGTIAATQTLGAPLLFSIAGSAGNTLESLIGWWLMVRVFGFSTAMTRVHDLIVLMLAGAPWGTMVNAVLCTLGLVAVGSVNPHGIPLSSLLFWTGNVLGILVFTPLVLRLWQRWEKGTLFRSSKHDLLWTALLAITVIVGFSIKDTAHTGLIPLAYLSFPLLVWLAFEWRRDVTLALAMVTVLMTAFTVTGHGPLVRYSSMATLAEMTIFIMVYAISSLILMAAVEEGRQLSRRTLDLRLSAVRNEAELRLIRANLNPHFLFNSLNTIKSLIPEDPSRAQTAVISLSDLLRTSLRLTKKERVPLREELCVIRSYLDLQKIRHEHRLNFSMNAADSSLDCLIPPMIFHQLVENAVKHGVENSPGSATILIRCVTEGNSLLLSVENSGHLDPGHSTGLGLNSITEELSAMYGEKAFFTLRQGSNRSVTAEIRLPAET